MSAKLELVKNSKSLSRQEEISLELMAIERLKHYQEPPPLIKIGKVGLFFRKVAVLSMDFVKAILKPVELERQLGPDMPAQGRHEWEKQILRPYF